MRAKRPVFLHGVQPAPAQVPDHLQVPDRAQVGKAPKLPQLLEEPRLPPNFCRLLVLAQLSLPQIASLLCNLQRLNVKEELRVALVHDPARFGIIRVIPRKQRGLWKGRRGRRPEDCRHLSLSILFKLNLFFDQFKKNYLGFRSIKKTYLGFGSI